MKFSVVFCLFLLGCTSKNNSTEPPVNNTIESTFKIDYKSENINPNKNVVEFSFDNKTILSRDDFDCKVSVYEGSLIIQLFKGKEEILISLGGANLYSQKPFSGIFTLDSQADENTALVSIHTIDDDSGEKIKAPMFFGGKAKIINFNEKEIRVDIDAQGGSYNQMTNKVNWKVINGTVVAKNPKFYENNVNIKNLFY